MYPTEKTLGFKGWLRGAPSTDFVFFPLKFLRLPRWKLSHYEALYGLRFAVTQASFEVYVKSHLGGVYPRAPSWVEEVGSLQYPNPVQLLSIENTALRFFNLINN